MDTKKTFIQRALDAVVEFRMRRAELEIAAFRGMHDDAPTKGR